MKNFKNLFVAVILTVFCFTFSTDSVKAQGFEEGRFYVDLGVGVPRHGIILPGYNKFNGNTSRTPGFTLSAKYGFLDFLSGGLYLGFEKSKYNYNYYFNDSYYVKNTHLTIAAGASFHVWAFLNNTLGKDLGVEKLDLYGTVLIGGHLNTRTEQDFDIYNELYTKKRTTGGPFMGGTVGARYYFLDWLGAYFEVGYSVSSSVLAGLTFKL